jgi:hypothetical protein
LPEEIDQMVKCILPFGILAVLQGLTTPEDEDDQKATIE